MIKPNRLTGLLHELCVTHGHCGGRVHVRDLLPTAGVITSERFAALVLEAEEIDRAYSAREYDRQHQLISQLFQQHMKSDHVQASEIKQT